MGLRTAISTIFTLMSLATYQQVIEALQLLSNSEKAKNSTRFFKTGKGQYGEGDVFMGVTMPEQRQLIKGFYHLPLPEIIHLLQQPEHECRMCALLLMVVQYKKANAELQQSIYQAYLQNTRRINNWDLVDASAEHIVGAWLNGRKEKRTVLEQLARSDNLWERRIAMLSTFYDIKKGQSADALHLAKLLLHDSQDLMHKAVGWMLREIGKRCSISEEEAFLRKHYLQMPGTMLRYAIEHFPETKRQAYLTGKIAPDEN